ncbi:phage tail tape measure protein [Clostridium perfringens]|nr:phage tail tape measure protein [Clostridium perfringens]
MNKFNSKETTLALKKVLSQIQQKNAKEYKKLGLDIKNKDGSFRSLQEILEDID